MIQTTSTTRALPIIYTGRDAEYQGFMVVFNWGYANNIIEFHTGGHVSYFPTSGTTINDGAWHSVLVTYDSVTLRIYVDDRLDNAAVDWNSGSRSIRKTLNTQGNNIYLGRPFFGNLWIGSMKNVNFYNYVLIPEAPSSDPTMPTAGPTLLFSSGMVHLLIISVHS